MSAGSNGRMDAEFLIKHRQKLEAACEIPVRHVQRCAHIGIAHHRKRCAVCSAARGFKQGAGRGIGG